MVLFVLDRPTEAKKALIRTGWNAADNMFVGSGAPTVNKHETCATIRANAEKSALYRIKADLRPAAAGRPAEQCIIIDVGCNHRRTLNAVKHVFGPDQAYYGLAPLLSDVDRHRQLSRGTYEHSCPHSFWECYHHGRTTGRFCWENAPHYRPQLRVVFLFVDVVYYLDMQELLFCLTSLDARAYGCNHSFTGDGVHVVPHTSVPEGEAFVFDGKVLMSVRGQATIYDHASWETPTEPIVGTTFNARLSPLDVLAGNHRAIVVNHGWELSFATIVTCGTYVAWVAIPSPSPVVARRGARINTRPMSTFLSECIATKCDSYSTVLQVVNKLLKRPKDGMCSLDFAQVIATKTWEDLQRIDKPASATSSHAAVNWLGCLRRRTAAERAQDVRGEMYEDLFGFRRRDPPAPLDAYLQAAIIGPHRPLPELPHPRVNPLTPVEPEALPNVLPVAAPAAHADEPPPQAEPAPPVEVANAPPAVERPQAVQPLQAPLMVLHPPVVVPLVRPPPPPRPPQVYERHEPREFNGRDLQPVPGPGIVPPIILPQAPRNRAVQRRWVPKNPT